MSTSDQSGYQSDFLGADVPFPLIPADVQSQLAHLVDEPSSYEITYPKYSVVQHAVRRFPLFTASNVAGGDFKRLPRKELFHGTDKWSMESRIESDAQWGSALYRADHSDFDKGHMTKREDVQWGLSDDEAADAARHTFFYTNAAPQHKKVNRSIWRKIEDYILKTEAVGDRQRINVFTGPVMDEEDPVFVTPVKDATIQLPTLFWKVVYYLREDGELARVAFLVGQKYLLEKFKIVRRQPPKKKATRARFLNFSQAQTYQIDVPLVEELTRLTFPPAIDAFTDERPKALILKNVNVRKRKRPGEAEEPGEILGLTL